MMMRLVAAALGLLISALAAYAHDITGAIGGSSSITAGTTPTSGCGAAGVLYSAAGLVQCNTGFTYNGGATDALVTINATTGNSGRVNLNANGVNYGWMQANSGSLIFSSANGAPFYLAIAGAIVMQMLGNASAVNAWQFYNSATGNALQLYAGGTISGVDANLSMQLISNGTGAVTFWTGGGAGNFQQVRVLNTTSANRTLDLTGSNGGNPTITTSAGNLALTSGGGTVAITGAASISALPVSAGAGGIFVCVDSSGVLYKKATCP